MLNLYDRDWPIRTYQPHLPAAEVRVHSRRPDRRGEALRQHRLPGLRSSPAARSAAASSRPSVRVNSYALVEDSILFDGVDVGRHARIRRAIIDKDVQVPPGFDIGWDREADLARGLTVTEDGITVVAKGEDLERFSPPDG